MAGWLGSVHKNRVFGNMTVNLLCSEYFTLKQYMLCDEALENSNCVGSSLNISPLRNMPKYKEKFNKKLASAIISAEHNWYNEG